MYNPKEAKKSYSILFKERGSLSAFQSVALIIFWFLLSKFILHTSVSIVLLIIGFLIFAIYFTWKSKIIRFLRGALRGNEYRDKAD